MANRGSGLLIDKETRRTEDIPQYNPPEGDLKLISAVQRKFQEKDRHKKAYEKTWFISHAAFVGHHYLLWNDLTASYEVAVRSPAHRKRVQVNKIKPYVRRTIARLSTHRPGLFVVPANNDDKSAEIAKLNTQTLDSEFDRTNFQERLKDNLSEMLEKGNMFFYLRWNPEAGPALTDDQGMSVLDDFGRPLHQGDVELEIMSAYEFDVDPNARNLEEATWCMRSTIRTLEWVREKYPQMGKFVKPQDVYANQFYLKRQKQLVGVYGYSTEDTGTTDRGSIENSVVVHEYWERPTPKYPRGRLVIVANGVLLYNREIPYKKMLAAGFWCPIVHTGEVKVPGRFWFQAIIEDLFPLNRIYNSSRSQEEENKALHGRPKIMVPRTAKMRQQSFDSEPGEKIDYSPGPNGEKPEVLYPQSTAAATEGSIRHTLADMDDVGSYHESSRGMMPSANAPAAALEKLQQADETALGLTESYLRDFICKLGKMWLCLVEEFWTEDRIARVGGETGSYSAYTVKGDMLAGEVAGANYHDVRMIPQSTMWRDPEKQRASILELIKAGVLMPDVHREVIIKALDQYHLNAVFDEDEQDRNWAVRENDMMRMGKWTQPKDFENHAIHIHTHDRFRKSDAYRALPEQLQQLFDEHVAMHKQLAVYAAQEKIQATVMAQAPAQEAEIQAQQASKAPPPGAGGAPPGAEPPPGAPAPEGGAPAPGNQPVVIQIFVGEKGTTTVVDASGKVSQMDPEAEAVPGEEEPPLAPPTDEEAAMVPAGGAEEDLSPFEPPPEDIQL